MSLINMVARSGLSYFVSGNHIYVECPKKNFHLTGKDNTESFCVNLDTNMYYCHSCGLRGKGTHGLFKLFGRKVYSNSRALFNRKNIVEQKQQETNSVIEIPQSVVSIFDKTGFNGFKYIWHERNPPFSYEETKLLGRRFNVQFCPKDTYIGKANIKDFLVIPIECEKSKVFTCRSTRQSGMKHFHPKGSNLGSLLFNYKKTNSETLILVEGPFDLFRMWVNGYRNVMATFGKCVSSQQKRLLLKLKPTLKNIIIMFDGEGFKQGEELAKDLGIFFNTYNSRLGVNEEPDTIDKDAIASYIFEAERILGI